MVTMNERTWQRDGYRELADLLVAIDTYETDPQIRYALVLTAMAQAYTAGLKTGFRGRRAFIELPAGQVSWAIPEHAYEADGASTDTMAERMAHFIAENYVEAT